MLKLVMSENKLELDVQRFLEVYKILSSEGKAMFEAQLAPSLRGIDERTKKLYAALLSSARDGLDYNGAILRMEEAAASLKAPGKPGPTLPR